MKYNQYITLVFDSIGDKHSNTKIIKVAAWIDTIPTSIHEAASKGSENKFE